MTKPIFQGAILTVLTLFGGLAIGFLVGSVIYQAIPGSRIENPLPIHITFAAVPALAGFLAGGAGWGLVMGRIAGATETRRLAFAGMAGFGPVVLIMALFLSVIEPPLLANFGTSTGIHRIFTLVFVPSAFLIAGISAWAIGRGLRDNVLARSLFWRVGLSGGLAFLVINLMMEAFGWVVGAPGAGTRFTMLTVMGMGNIGAAVIGGGVMGLILKARA
ncbi:MAG: hypothetical protein H6636_10460 [Anaerolineales bacterium]|nr:hypothetical protein [Anaerolineales bacterium]